MNTVALARKPRVTLALRSRTFALLWSGQTISALGNGTFYTTLAWQALVLTHSAAAVGVIETALLIPQLLALPFGGVAADRLPRRFVMLLSDGLRAAVVLLIALLGWFHLLLWWHLIALALVFGFVSGFFDPAYRAFLPQLTDKEMLPSVNTLTSLSRQSTLIFGPPLAVWLILISGPQLSFAFNGLTFVISALCLLWVVVPPIQGAAPRGTAELNVASRLEQKTKAEKAMSGTLIARMAHSFFADLAEGLRYVVQTPWLWISILLFAFINVGTAGSMQVAIPRLAQIVGGANPWLLGSMKSGMALGGVAGALLIGQLQPQRRRGLLLYLITIASSSSLLCMGLPWPQQLFPIALLITSTGLGLTLGVFDVIWVTLLQELVPTEKLGRVSSLDFFFSFALIPLGFLPIGLAIDHFGPDGVFLFTGMAGITLALLALCVRSIRQLN